MNAHFSLTGVVHEKGTKAIKVKHTRDKLKPSVLHQLFNPVDPSEARCQIVIGALTALKRAAKEAKRAQHQIICITHEERSFAPPPDFSEPHANNHFVDPPPPPPISLESQRSRSRIDQYLERDTRYLFKRELNSGLQKF